MKGGLCFPQPAPFIPDCFCHLIQADFDLLSLVFSLHLSFRSSAFSASFSIISHCCNPFLGRPSLRHPSFSRQGDPVSLPPLLALSSAIQMFSPWHLDSPWSSFACWKWPSWVHGRVLSSIFFVTLESFYCKNKFTTSRLFSPDTK